MRKSVAITGMGIVSSVGLSVEENFNSLCEEKHGLSRIENVETKHKNNIFVGEIKKTNEEIEQILNLPSCHNVTRTGMLGILAARDAIKDANIETDCQERIGLISASSVGGMDSTEKYIKSFEENKSLRRFISSHEIDYSSQHIADYLGLKGLVTSVSTACSSAANAIMLGANLIKCGRYDKLIVGGTDALCRFTINGFNTLMILSDSYCQPFDQNRKGLNLGEAAAYIVLESDKSVKKRNKNVLAYLSGYGNANDAFHQTATSENGEGAFLAMKKAFDLSSLRPENIDYINMHGTATPNNDLSEGRAVKRIFASIPSFSSTKPFTGHTLAAAAAIEAVYSILSLNNNLIFPNLNFQTTMEELDLIPEQKLKEKEIKNVLSNSFGFGGNCSTLLFSKQP